MNMLHLILLIAYAKRCSKPQHNGQLACAHGRMLRLGTTLGISDKEDQMKHIHLALLQLAAEEDAARDDQGRYEKMWKSLGILIAVLIVILMV
jgi:stage III sporulation protein AB